MYAYKWRLACLNCDLQTIPLNSYIDYMHKPGSTLDNLQGLICYKTHQAICTIARYG